MATPSKFLYCFFKTLKNLKHPCGFRALDNDYEINCSGGSVKISIALGKNLNILVSCAVLFEEKI
jgi:hypothetical protein